MPYSLGIMPSAKSCKTQKHSQQIFQNSAIWQSMFPFHLKIFFYFVFLEIKDRKLKIYTLETLYNSSSFSRFKCVLCSKSYLKAHCSLDMRDILNSWPYSKKQLRHCQRNYWWSLTSRVTNNGRSISKIQFLSNWGNPQPASTICPLSNGNQKHRLNLDSWEEFWPPPKFRAYLTES